MTTTNGIMPYFKSLKNVMIKIEIVNKRKSNGRVMFCNAVPRISRKKKSYEQK